MRKFQIALTMLVLLTASRAWAQDEPEWIGFKVCNDGKISFDVATAHRNSPYLFVGPGR